MWWMCVLMTMMGPNEATQPQGGRSAEQVAAEAVAAYERPWTPAGGELRGVVVGIQPSGGGSGDPAVRVGDDLAMRTAGYLYHMVIRAGGTPIMTRVDDNRAVQPTAGSGPRRQVVITVVYEEKGDKKAFEAEAAGGEPFSRPLSDDLVACVAAMAAGGQKEGPADAGRSKGRPVDEESSVGCVIRLRYDPRDAVVRDRPWEIYRANAATVCRGVIEYCRMQGLGGGPVRAEGEECSEPSAVPLTNTTMERRLRSVGRLIWPEGDLPDDRVDWFCGLWARLSITNRSLVVFQPSATVEDGVVVVRGVTDTPALMSGLETALKGIGVEKVRMAMRALPDPEKLEGKLFGACRAAMAITYDRPDTRSGQQTQLLFGEPVFLLDREPGWLLLHGGDGYWGWVREDAIQVMAEAEFAKYMDRPRAVVVEDVDLGALRIPRGARGAVTVGDEGALTLVAPDGSERALPPGKVRLEKGAAQAAAERVRAALDLLHTPYVFGGRSPLGLDCSGLVNNVCARTGLAAARDASQQVVAGSLVATRWYKGGMKAGDIVYFIDRSGKVYHEGIAIDGTHIVDSTPPGVQIGSIEPGDRLYDERQDHDFFMVKRP